MVDQNKYINLILNLCQKPIRRRDIYSNILYIDYQYFMKTGQTFSTEDEYRKSTIGCAFMPVFCSAAIDRLKQRKIIYEVVVREPTGKKDYKREYVLLKNNVSKNKLDFNIDSLKIIEFDFFEKEKWQKFEFGEVYSMKEIYEIYK